MEAPDIAANAVPGQFVQLRAGENYFPFWPRPFSIFDTDARGGSVTLMFKVYGSGTSVLASRIPGQKMHLFGPLGNGFSTTLEDADMIMAAGGIGFPPLYFLAKTIIDNGFSAQRIVFIAGARSKLELLNDKGLLDLGVNLIITTDDGSAGRKGTVIDVLRELLSNGRHPMVYACGPNAMLMETDRILQEKKLSGFLSLESLMPCGYGICSGCAVKVVPPSDRGPTDDKRDYHLKRVCVEGPVFGIGEVIW